MLIVIQPDRKPLAFPIDFQGFMFLANGAVQAYVSICKVKSCAQIISKCVPLELLEFEDGETLGERCYGK